MAERSDWVELLEPRSGERMYVNLATGECGWEPPPERRVRQADHTQWWELFDPNSSRFYYYNATSRQTVWHRPQGCDIVPLAQLQARKGAGGSSPSHRALPQEGARSGAERRPDPGRDTPTCWQPAPGTRAAMLVKVNGVRHVQESQSPAEATGQNPLLSSPVQHAPAQRPAAAKPAPPAETSVQVKETEAGGLCGVRGSGAPCHVPPQSETGTPQPASRKQASPAPIYDEPSLDSPVYDEPPVDMDTGHAASPQVSPSNSIRKLLQPARLLQRPGQPQQPHAGKRPGPNLSSTEYSPAGREYIKHMVNVEHSAKLLPGSGAGAESRAKPQPALLSSDSVRQSCRALEANALKHLEAQRSRQSSPPAQEYPTAVSQQDSGYSTGPSPSLRKRRGRRLGAGQGRPGSVGSSSELSALNEKLLAEMRAVVGKSAACRGSKASLEPSLVEGPPPPGSSKVRFQSDPLKPGALQRSRDDVTSSSRSLFRPGLERRESCSNDLAPQQDVGRSKRAYEKTDSLEKNGVNQTSLASDAARASSQPGTLVSEPTPLPACPGQRFPCPALRQPLSPSSMAAWASQNLNLHTQGLFRRRLSLATMLSWSGGPIRKPMLVASSHAGRKEACELFRLVQIYMGDRQACLDRDQVALLAVTKCWSTQGLRDELYMQLIRQTTDNGCYRSLAGGWELLAISLAFFSPSPKFQSYLEGYIYGHLDQTNDGTIAQRMKELLDLRTKKNSKSRKKRKQNTEDEGLPISTYARFCYRKLQKVAVTGGKKGLRKPTLEEITLARSAIVTPSLFGSSLEEIMSRQQAVFPKNKLPWVQTQLSQQVLALGGEQAEGIFRIPGDIDEVNALKLQVDQWRIPNNLSDPNIPASLLKLWYRELEEPVVPPQFYAECIRRCQDPDAAVAVVQLLPEFNRLVLCYLIHFLQIFAQPTNVGKTKMDVNNLAMVMAPNCLRCESDDPRVIFENTRKEMSFLRMLIVHLDTGFIPGLV
ncbi:rho GTPase-activating protein 39-like isoform X2 [Pelodiscus sinensis]|uniref:rho GTPase-activating protein 39-like isoform X2 n=1 Tax=Pelodiscus sinensis TaxID=13735 RepID=UPI003F6B3CC7